MGTVQAKDKTEKPMETVNDALNYTEKTEIHLDGIPARVDKIHINGLGRTKDDIVHESVKELFKANDFQEVIVKTHSVRSKLDTLGCFRNIGVYIDVSKGPEATEDGLEVTFYVREFKRVIGGVNTTVSNNNNEGSLVLGAKMPNMFGRGERIQTEFSYGSKKTNNFSLQFVKPLLGTYNSVVSSSLYQTLSEYPWSGYKQIDRGLLVDFSFTTLDFLRHSVGYDACVRDLGTLNRAVSFKVREYSGLSLKSSLRHKLEADFRDEAIFPSFGSYFKLTNELAGLGGDISYLKNEMYVQSNVSLLENVVLQAGAELGAVTTQTGGRVSLSDQFYLGGPLSLRGFQTRGVGPHADGNSLGSDVFWALGLHVFAPLPFLSPTSGFNSLFRTHFFVNAGNVASLGATDKGAQADVLDALHQLRNNVRVAYGVGLAVKVGHIARVELNYCFPIKYQRGDQLNPGVQFGIGLQFL